MRALEKLTMILAGGIGERLYPLTARRSKPAVPFGGNFRIIDFTLMNCVLSGLRRIYLLTQYHSLSLGHHRTERWNFLCPELGEFVELVPPKMRTATGFYHGTADAIYRNLDILDQHRPDVVLVLSGDHVYRADYNRFIESHLEGDADVSVLTDAVRMEEATSFGVVRTGGARIEEFIEKPEDPSPWAVGGRCLVNLGVYCFTTPFLVHLLVQDAKKKTAHDFGKNVLPHALDEGLVASVPLDVVCPDDRPYWRDVGTLDSYFRANMDLLDTPPAFDLRDRRWPAGSRFHEWLPAMFPGSVPRGSGREPVRNLVSSGCEVSHADVSGSVLSPGVRIGAGSRIEESIILQGADIGNGVRLRRVIVEEDVRVPDGADIGGDVDCRDFTRSPEGVVVVSASHLFDEPATRGGPSPAGGRESGLRTASSRASRGRTRGAGKSA